MPTLATLIKILSTSLWAHFKSFGCFIEKNRKQVFSGHCLGSRPHLSKQQKLQSPNLAGLTIGDPCYKDFVTLVILPVAFGSEAPSKNPTGQPTGQKNPIFGFIFGQGE